MNDLSDKSTNLKYGQMPLPDIRKSYKSSKRSWSGLNYKQKINTGALSFEKNISTTEAPYLTPSQKPSSITSDINKILQGELKENNAVITGVFGFDDFLLLTANVSKTNRNYIVCYDKNKKFTYANFLSDYSGTRCIVQFNVYSNNADAVEGEYTKKLLMFPEKLSFDYNITPDEIGSKATFDLSSIPEMPAIRYATVHLSRLFGVDETKIYASGYNDYSNWNLDTAEEYNESNAWCSTAQSNTKAGGNFTGIISFQNHVVCFKRDFMHEIYNTKNPFRIQDVYAEGAVDNRTIQEVDGNLIFVSDDNVKIYTGSNPRIISHDLNIQRYNNPVSGTDGRFYYLYCTDDTPTRRFLVYDTLYQTWSERSSPEPIVQFACASIGIYALTDSGQLYKLDTEDYTHEWSFETDLITNETLDIKHLKKIQMLADIDAGSHIEIYALYDNETWSNDDNFKLSHLIYSSESLLSSGQTTIRVKPRKTANYGIKLHVEGYGYVKIHEMELITEIGGELYV